MDATAAPLEGVLAAARAWLAQDPDEVTRAELAALIRDAEAGDAAAAADLHDRFGARLAFGTAAIRWSQLGYGRTSSTSTAQTTPRNLFGFKDGTANIMAEETSELDTHVWVSPEDDPAAAWLAGGSYLVARRIRMTGGRWACILPPRYARTRAQRG